MPFVLVSAQFTIDKRCATTAARRGLAQDGEGAEGVCAGECTTACNSNSMPAGT